MHLELSDKFSRLQSTEDIRSDLEEYLSIRETQYLFRKSIDPPSFIRLLGEALDWLPLAIPANIFLGTIAKHAGDATWDAVTSLFRDRRVKPLIGVAETLSNAAKQVHPEAEIVVGVNIPHDVRCAADMCIRSTSPERYLSNVGIICSPSREYIRRDTSRDQER